MARSKSDKAFDERVAQYSEELRELLTDLYGEQADEAFRNLTELMAKAHDARPADLKRLDTKRLADPEWYKRGNMFGMTMYTDLFAGDLKKLADKVPYLKEQKLTYLHLMPLLKMPHPQNDGGSPCLDATFCIASIVSFSSLNELMISAASLYFSLKYPVISSLFFVVKNRSGM